MDSALTTPGSKSKSKSKSKSNEATSSGALVSCTNRSSKRKNKVKVIVVDETNKEIEEIVATLMKKDANGDRESVIGFEVEYATSILPINGPKTRISHLIFTDGKFAYVIYLGLDPRLPRSLLSFLHHPEFTFVSIGMHHHVNNLDQLYEAGCRNAVDLGELASQLKGSPHLRSCGIDLLAEGIGLSETPRPSSVVFKKKAYSMVDEDEMCESVVNTWAYQLIGKTLLHGSII